MEVGVIGENGVHVHDRVKVSSLDLEHVIHRNQLMAAHDVEAAMGSGGSVTVTPIAAQVTPILEEG